MRLQTEHILFARCALNNWQQRTANYTREELLTLREVAGILPDESHECSASLMHNLQAIQQRDEQLQVAA